MTFAVRPLGLSAIGAGWFSADQVSALLHFNGTNGSSTFTDATGLNTWTRTNFAQIETAQKMFGTASGYFNNNSQVQRIIAPTASRFDLLGGDFTVAFFARPTNNIPSGSRRAVQIGNGDSWGNTSTSTTLTVGFAAGEPYLGLSNASASPVLHNSGAAQTLNTWDAWCWAVSPTTAKLYRNGAQVYSGAHSGLANPAGVSFRCAVGNGLGAPGDNDDGIRAHIDELVIVKGWAGDISGITSEIVL